MRIKIPYKGGVDKIRIKQSIYNPTGEGLEAS